MRSWFVVAGGSRRAPGRVVGLAVLGALVVAGACSGGERAAVPEGFVEARVDGVATFAHPDGWEAVDPKSDRVRMQVEAPGPAVDGVPTTGIQVIRYQVRPSTEIEQLVAVQLTELGDGRVNFKTPNRRAVEVDGATGAELVEATFETAGAGAPVDAFFVFALDGDDNGLTFVVAGTDVDPDVARRIVDTLRLE